ncbi:MAG TPA: enoyl-CoA hydratase-related protein [Chloroflexia bacterium]|nr:enoyl-CoA hydratase-related protein [Chloroflexia bacterium]
MSIDYLKKDRLAYITINRPEAMNALDPAHYDEMIRVWQDFKDDDSCWVAILTGAGDKAFSAGADLKTLIPRVTGLAREGQEIGDWNFGGITRHFQTWKPIIAAINGHALAGGMEMVLACDLRIASENARLGLAEVKWGIIPGAGGTQRLPRAIPLAKAMEILLTGEPIDAQEAYRLGLVNKVVPQENLMQETEKLAQLLLERGPLALRAVKQAVLQGLDRPLEQGLELELDLFARMARTADALEGPRAFAEKRKPNFRAE